MTDNAALVLVRTLTGQSDAIRRLLEVGAVLTTGILPTSVHEKTPSNAATAMVWWGSHGFSVSIHLRPGADSVDVIEGHRAPRVVIQEHGDQPPALPWTPYRATSGKHVLVLENRNEAERTIVTFIDYVLSRARFRDESGHFWALPR